MRRVLPLFLVMAVTSCRAADEAPTSDDSPTRRLASAVAATMSAAPLEAPGAAAAATCDVPPCTGNAWHLAGAPQDGIPSMRDPHRRIEPGTSVTFYTGNQAGGEGGNPGNQLEEGSVLVYRPRSETDWTEVPMTFHSEVGNNKFYAATLDTTGIAAGTVLEYYFRLPYSDHLTTFVHGSEDESFTTEEEGIARAAPFTVQVRVGPSPSGEADVVDLQPGEVRVHSSGHLELVSDADPALVLLPPSLKLDGHWEDLGPAQVSADGDALTLRHEVGGATVVAELRAEADGVARYEVVDWGGVVPEVVELAAPSDSDEHVTGFGEKFDRLEQSGKTVQVLSVDAPGDKGDRSYKAVPWFMSSRGYGFSLDTTVPSEFDMREGEPDRIRIRYAAPELAYRLVAGPAFPDILERYTSVTGRPPLPPPWVFAPWMSSDHWRTGGEVRYVVETYRAHGIPGSVFVFDSPWETAYNDFEWNMSQFGAGGTYDGTFYEGFESAPEMLEFLREHGFVVVLWLTPLINVESVDEGVPGQNTGKAGIYDAAAEAGYLVEDGSGEPLVVEWWKGRGSPVDFTSPAATSWFQGKLEALVDESSGVVAGFKTDDGESDFIPEDARYADGRTGLHMKNGYSIEYHAAVHGVLGDQGILFSRSGYTGTHAYPGCWSGDNEPNFGSENGLASVIVAGQTAAMSAYAIWGHDIGGYQETNPSSTPENLFVRWTQFGAFSPIMQMHRQVGQEMQYPWSYGDDALENYRAYAELHTELFPYLYSYAAVAAERGLPIIRPLALHHQDDPETYARDHSYLFGEWLLIAPMTDNLQTTRTVYLPDGIWYDFWSQQRFDGGQEVSWTSTDQHRLPLFVRSGAAIPMLDGDVDSLVDADYGAGTEIATAPSAWRLLVYPGDESGFTAYEGTRMSAVVDGEAIVARVDGGARRLRLEILGDEPESVFRGDQELSRVPSLEELESAEGWTVDGSFVVVALDHAGGEVTLTLGTRDDIPEDVEPGEPGGCGCQTGGSGGASTTALAIALVAAVRRRR